MNDEAIQRKYLGDEAKGFIFVLRDLRQIRLHYTPGYQHRMTVKNGSAE
jgi:hypothetical protein